MRICHRFQDKYSKITPNIQIAKMHAIVDCEQSLNFLARSSSRERREPPPTNSCATVALSCEGKKGAVDKELMNGRWQSLMTLGRVTYWNWHSFRFKALLRIKAKNSPERNTKNFCIIVVYASYERIFFQVSWTHRRITYYKPTTDHNIVWWENNRCFWILISVPDNNATQQNATEQYKTQQNATEQNRAQQTQQKRIKKHNKMQK